MGEDESDCDRVYHASEITADSKIRAQIRQLQESGYGHYPVCVAKTQYSFSTDPKLRGAPSGHVVNIREVRLAAGAEFIVMICGEIMTMPGLPGILRPTPSVWMTTERFMDSFDCPIRTRVGSGRGLHHPKPTRM